jgi:PIN domain nuclease of toxin-antitoxin system
LLDTCSFLWLAEGNERLSVTAREVIKDPVNEGVVSVVSLWELSMKAVVGKLPMPLPPALLAKHASSQGLDVLSMTVAHVEIFHALPTVHRDPFDRLLAAVALHESLSIISPDTALDTLGVKRLW